MTLASGFYDNKRLYPELLYNEADIDHGANTISNRGEGGDLTMTNFARNNGTVSTAAGTLSIANNTMVCDGGTVPLGNIAYFDQTTSFSYGCKFKFTARPASGTSGIFGSFFDTSPRVSASGNLDYALRGSSIVSEIYGLLSLDTEYTFHFVYDHTVTKFYFYINGVLDNTGGTTGPTTFATDNWGIGHTYLWGGTTGQGEMDIYHARIYNKALTPTEVTEEANSGTYSTITDGSLVAQYTGADYAGTTASPTTIYDTNMVVRGDTRNAALQTGIKTYENDGTVSGGVTIADSAMVFNNDAGDDDYFRVTKTLGTSGSFIIELTADATSDARLGRFLVRETFEGFFHAQYGTNQYHLYYRYPSGSGIPDTQFILNLTDVTQKNVLYIARDASNFYHSINGGTITTTANTNSRAPNITYYDVGGNGGRGFKGTIHRVFEYDRILTESEITAEIASSTYSTITDGSLVSSYTGVDYAGTAGSPTTIYNTAGVADITQAGYGIELDGTNDYLVLANSTDYSGIDWSFFCRVYFNSLPAASATSVLFAQAAGTGTGRGLLYLNNSAGTVTWRSFLGGSDSTFSTLGNPTTGVWYNCAFIKEGTKITLHVDELNESRTRTMESANGNIYIGSSQFATNPVDGVIQDPMLIQKPVTPTEVKRVFAGRGPK